MEFLGYRRSDGRVGIRNHVLILPACACGSESCRVVASQVRGAVNIIFNTGCSDVAANTAMSQKVLTGFALNPNVYGVVIIGLGCENLDGKPFEQVQDTVNAALECGINLFDVFMPGNEIRENIARALGSRRDQVMIQGHIGSTDIRQQYDISRDLPVVKQYFENLLRIFGYIDFGMMFFIDSEEDYKGVFETGFADYVQ